jgi:hypothetical protein
MLKEKMIAHNGKEIVLRKGDRILNMRSGHYTTTQMRAVVGKVLRIEKLWYNEKFMILLCRR